MSNSSSEYETHAATLRRIEQTHGKAWPNIAALGLYLGIPAAIVLGAAISAHGTTAPLDRGVSVIAQQNAVVSNEPLGGTAGILHASDVMESQLWECASAENCHEAPPAKVVGRVRTAASERN